MYLGRLQQGMNLNVTVRTGTPAGVPGWPTARPVVEVWRDGATPTKLDVVPMASYLPGVIEGLFRACVFLGALYPTAGRHFVVVRWVDQDGTPRLLAGSFELTGGGNAAGTVIAMTEVARPDARYLLTSTDAGTISRRKNPR